MPLLLDTCLKILARDRRIAISRSTKGIVLINIGFDLERFERERLVFKEQELRVIDSLIRFSSELGVVPKWTEQQSREYLSRFLLKDDFGLNLALTGDVRVGKSSKLSTDWYIGRYVSKLPKDSEEYNYLVKVSHGLMVYMGIAETSNDKQEFSQKFAGTDFYLDTKIILRAMGLSLPFYEQTAKDLIELIRKYNKGNIVIFDHTFDEVQTALSNAAREMKYYKRVNDDELNLYRLYYGCDEDDFLQIRDSAKEKIQKIMGIEIKSSCQDWNDNNVQSNNLDWAGLYKKITEDHPKWKDLAIKNDVTSINTINIIRRHDYSQRFGGIKKLPIFVTTNTALIASVREFVAEEFDAKEQTVRDGWSKNRLPIISEGVLLCRLWAPQSSKLSSMPVNILAANAFAAQQAESEFYEKIKKECEKAHVLFKDTPLNVENYRDRKLEETLVTQSHGDIEKIDESLIALSLDEMLKIETINDKQEIERLKEVSTQTNQEKLEQVGALFSAFCKQFTRKNYCRGLRCAAKINNAVWPFILVFFFTCAGEILVLLISNVTNPHKWVYILPIIIGAILAIMDRLIDKCGVARKIQQKINIRLKEIYINSISRDIPDEVSFRKEEIIQYCASHSDCF